jgi:hypothetical protein
MNSISAAYLYMNKIANLGRLLIHPNTIHSKIEGNTFLSRKVRTYGSKQYENIDS